MSHRHKLKVFEWGALTNTTVALDGRKEEFFGSFSNKRKGKNDKIFSRESAETQQC